MKTRLLLILFLSVPVFFQPLLAQINTSDSLALVDLYNSTKGAEWKKSTNWLTTKPVKTWYGITVTGDRVTAIALTQNKLGGRLRASIGNLTALTSLNLYLNHISGAIPQTIGNLTNLTYLAFTFNYLSGSIPSSIGKLTKLTFLSVNSNKLTDTVPSSIGNLAQLTNLYLGNNQLSGKAPEAIGKLVNLTDLDLNLNQFSGEVPVAIYNNLSKLEILGLNNNQFSGNISASIENLVNLRLAYLQDNQFNGQLPSTIGNMQKLELLDVTNNQVAGSIPSAISSCPVLNTLRLENNKLTGTLPASLANMPELHDLRISNNQLSGELPKKFISGSNLIALYASQNHLTISKNYTNQQAATSLSAIDISYNAFTFNGLEFIAAKVDLPTYNNQDTIPTRKNGNVLSVSAGGTLSNNTYRWFKAGTNIVIATKVSDSTFQPTESGSYYAKVTNSVATDLTLVSAKVSFTPAVAPAVLQIAVSPNPVINSLLVSGLNAKLNAAITIADMSGYIWIRTGSHQQSFVKIDVSGLRAGNYLVNVSDGKEVKTSQFVKQ